MSVFREEKSCRDECVHIYLHVNLHPVPPCAQICEGEICPNLTCENARHGNIYLAEMYRINSLTEIEFLQLKLTPKAPSSKNEAIAKEKGIKLQLNITSLQTIISVHLISFSAPDIPDGPGALGVGEPHRLLSCFMNRLRNFF